MELGFSLGFLQLASPVHSDELTGDGDDVWVVVRQSSDVLRPLDGWALGDAGCRHKHAKVTWASQQKLLLRETSDLEDKKKN